MTTVTLQRPFKAGDVVRYEGPPHPLVRKGLTYKVYRVSAPAGSFVRLEGLGDTKFAVRYFTLSVVASTPERPSPEAKLIVDLAAYNGRTTSVSEDSAALMAFAKEAKRLQSPKYLAAKELGEALDEFTRKTGGRPGRVSAAVEAAIKLLQ